MFINRLSIQVNPRNYRNWKKMVDQAVDIFNKSAKFAIKIPTTEAGLKAIEELAARGVSVTATVAFSVSQGISFAEDIEHGLERAEKKV